MLKGGDEVAELWVLADKAETAKELLAHAKSLAGDETIACLTGSAETAEAAAAHGADRVLLYEGGSRPESYVPHWCERARLERPAALLLGADRRSKEIAARMAARLQAGLISDCVKLERREGFYSERYLFGGLCLAGETTGSAPFLATMAAGKAQPLPAGAPASVEKVTVSCDDAVRRIDLRPHRSASNLMEAKVIVCAGRGVAKQEDLKLAEELARALGGEVGCTRPVAEERHWMPEENYIGITGKKPAPELYITLGVSGQIQHMSGVRDSKCIVAIEKNDGAPITEAADYTIIGDLYEVVPKMLAELRS
ncbi:MAG: electron transfer flavoprotein subunit alpha/FixB family protein [Gracilibacteraceae bacterium]|jgi:electron transfer flavoprotein alpha subunit|nr:electron transfer flavoprotein subunit alpha/FixB family protein [Gracilibacteraceae bacterium]